MEDHSRELKEDLESTASEEKHTKSQVEHQSPVSTSQVHIRRPVMQERVISQSENKEEQDYNNLRFTSHTGSSIDMHSESAGMSRYMSSNINTIDEETTPTSIENHSLQMTSNFGMSDSQSKLKSMQSLPVGFPPSKRSKYAKSHISSAVVNKNPALQMPVPNKRSDSQEKDTQKQSILQGIIRLEFYLFNKIHNLIHVKDNFVSIIYVNINELQLWYLFLFCILLNLNYIYLI